MIIVQNKRHFIEEMLFFNKGKLFETFPEFLISCPA